MAASFDLIEHLPRLACIFAGRDVAGGRDAIEQVMRDAGSFGSGGLGRPDVELAVHGDGIAIHDLATEALGKRQRKRRLPAGRWAQHDHQQRFRLRRSHRQRTLQWMTCQ